MAHKSLLVGFPCRLNAQEHQLFRSALPGTEASADKPTYDVLSTGLKVLCGRIGTQSTRRGTWKEIFARAAKEKLPKAQLAALTRWIPKNRVEQKRLDALAMLGRMRRASRQRTLRSRPRFVFEHTQYWQSLLDRYRA